VKCSQCQQKTKVVDSRQLMSEKGNVPFTWRRLKCAQGHITYTHEVCESISPIKETIRSAKIIKLNIAKRPTKPKKKHIRKVGKRYVPIQEVKDEPIHETAMQKLGLKVTKSSPEWLKRIALQLE
jgi:transcriptional regulator NrdR family protein